MDLASHRSLALGKLEQVVGEDVVANGLHVLRARAGFSRNHLRPIADVVLNVRPVLVLEPVVDLQSSVLAGLGRSILNPTEIADGDVRVVVVAAVFVDARDSDAQGFAVTEEYAIGGGKTVDVHATRGEEQLLVEIETGRSDIEAKAAKLCDQGGRVVFVFTDAHVREGHRASVLALLPAARLLTTGELQEIQ